MEIAQIVQQVMGGVSIGAIYGLLALGFSLMFRASNIVHFAQGDFFMLGSYAAITFYLIIGLPFWLSVILSTACVSLVGIGFEKIAYKPLWKSHHSFILMSTAATSIVLQNSSSLIWGPDAWRFPQIFSDRILDVFGVLIPVEIIWVVIGAVIIMVVFNAFLQKTKLGKGFRAAAQDREMAQGMGVSLLLADSFVFGISAGLGAVGGVLVAPILFVTPYMGLIFTLKGFTAAVLGGLGSIRGAIVGGFLLGVMENLSTAFISSAYKDAIVFALLLLILLFKPSGLLAKPTAEKI
ncbi:MAG: branched-chain amino acid ABC transporter permease [Bradyrhizobiaceae bacterium]|nr:branched-chain amino acid ABC transporter permease [Bradyrhizobiaceae bacterium]